MSVGPDRRTSWLMRLGILAAMIMLVAGIGMISGYFGGVATPTPVPTTTVAGGTAVIATSQAAFSTATIPGRSTAAAITERTFTPAPAATATGVVAQNTAIKVAATNTAVPAAQVSPPSQASATSVVGSTNMATAVAVAVQSTIIAQASTTQASAMGATSTAQVVSALSTVSAQDTAQANSNANATSTAATAAQVAATQQAQQTQVAQQAQQTQIAQQAVRAAPTSLALSVIFEEDFYRGIDVWKAAREEFGAGAALYSRCEGMNCWYVKSGSQVRPLDLKRAVAKQYGPDWTLVAVGAGKSDWRAVRFTDLNYAVLPVMMVSSDRLNDVKGVNTGLARFRTVLANSQYWYYERVRKTFRLLQPVIVATERTSTQWNNLSAMYTNKDTLAQAAWSQYARQLPAPGNNIRVVVAPYTGENYAIEQGALSMPGFAVAPALTTSLWCPQSGQLDRSCQSASYLVGQALGLSFGLRHSCAAYPGDPRCSISLMQEGKPPGAILLQAEIEKLAQSPFFTRY